MATEKHDKFQIASNQLETAIGLFVSDCDCYSVITLAGAADGILTALVIRKGKKPFVDYVCMVEEAESGITPPRGKLGSHINDVLNINALKHMDEDGDEFVEMDVTECAVGAILKAVSNYKQLVEDDPDFIKAFLAWTWKNMEGSKVMEAYENRLERLR